MTVIPEDALSGAEEALIEELVSAYIAEEEKYKIFQRALLSIMEAKALTDLIHSYKARLKDPEHLRDKLRRKTREAKAKGENFDITSDNLFNKITDLAGLRILHLHTRQIVDIDRALRATLEAMALPLVEAPFARTWDDENRAFFEEIGFETRKSKSLYTSVHYVVEANLKAKLTGEIQVRTLAEELWGEVDHTINYPHKSSKKTCQEQILVLARATSTCSRLVDSIFAAHNE
jgi:putative GTP pyrophosphokinase